MILSGPGSISTASKSAHEATLSLTIGEGEFDGNVWLPGQFSKFARQVNST
jgi:hypothetical protein